MTTLPSCYIESIGVYAPGFPSWEELSAELRSVEPINSSSFDENCKGPKPNIIPTNERRRAPLSVRIAVESSWQAACRADLNPADMNSVFGSALGDTALTDYMCRVLASASKALSPTKFHNSVHNAPAGYWTISTHTQGSATSIAGFKNTVSLALLEAMIQCGLEKRQVLMTCYDTPVPPMLQPIMPNTLPFSCSFILSPVEPMENQSQDHKYDARPLLSATVSSQKQSAWPNLSTKHQLLNTLYKSNPSARLLPLLTQLAYIEGDHDNECIEMKKHPIAIEFPLSEATQLKLIVTTKVK